MNEITYLQMPGDLSLTLERSYLCKQIYYRVFQDGEEKLCFDAYSFPSIIELDKAWENAKNIVMDSSNSFTDSIADIRLLLQHYSQELITN